MRPPVRHNKAFEARSRIAVRDIRSGDRTRLACCSRRLAGNDPDDLGRTPTRTTPELGGTCSIKSKQLSRHQTQGNEHTCFVVAHPTQCRQRPGGRARSFVLASQVAQASRLHRSQKQALYRFDWLKAPREGLASRARSPLPPTDRETSSKLARQDERQWRCKLGASSWIHESDSLDDTPPRAYQFCFSNDDRRPQR